MFALEEQLYNDYAPPMSCQIHAHKEFSDHRGPFGLVV